MKVGYCTWFPFLLGCVLLALGDRAIEECTRERSAIECRGRCVAAASKNLTVHTDCLTKCCSSASGFNNTMEYPPDCPLLQLNCSANISLYVPPQVAWRNGVAVLLYDDSLLAAEGRDACNSVEPVDANTLPVVVSADNTVFWLVIPGKETLVSLLYSGCHNISVATVDECGVSAFSSPRVTQPPSLTLSNVVQSAMESDGPGSFPNITVSWTLSGSQYVENITANITMVKTPASARQEGCLTASKVYQAQMYPFDESIVFTPQDFEGTSVWLCHYDLMVDIGYSDPCTLAEGTISGSSALGTQITLPYNVGVSASGDLVWNQTDTTYTLHANWTVPRTYNLPETIISFVLVRLTSAAGSPFFFLEDEDFQKDVPATGNISYEATLYGLPAGMGDLAFRVKFVHDIAFGQHFATVGPFPALGEAPSQVDIPIVSMPDKGGVRVAWTAPSILNGVIHWYHVEVRLLNKNEQIVSVKMDRVMGNLTLYFFNLSEVADELTVYQASFRVAAQNEFLLGIYSNASVITLDIAPPIVIVDLPRNDSNSVVLPAVLVPVLALLLIVLLSVLIVSILMWRLHKNSVQLAEDAAKLPSMEPSLYNYAAYFSKLPPVVADRWMLRLDIFNSQSFRLIGEGNFSSVYLCKVQCPLNTPTRLDKYRTTYSEQAVAVKLLVGTSGDREVESFLNEAKVMKRLSAQTCEYIIQLVGIQMGQAPAMIAMELATCGNFLNILKNSWMADEDDSVFPDNDNSNESFELKKTKRKTSLTDFQKMRLGHINSYVQLVVSGSGRDGSLVPDDSYTVYLKPSQLLRFAVQIAKGMEYIASCGVVHRDLACRNLLLATDDLVKIADFGFACTLDGKEYIVEDLPAESKPLRWMSPEAFEENVYSEASDVWSFGVTLWEIFSTGLFPYPALSDYEVLAAVKGGADFELECPNQCDQQVYNLMLQCWKVPPNERPQFPVLRQSLMDILCTMYPYLEVQESAPQ